LCAEIQEAVFRKKPKGSGGEKIKFFKSASCSRCPIAKFILLRVLTSMGMDYDQCVTERDTERDSDAMAELLMLDCVQTPVLKLGSILVKEEEALKEKAVREAVQRWAAGF